MTGEPIHAASKESNGAAHNNYITYRLKLYCQLCLNQELFNVIKVAAMKNASDLHIVK